MRITLHDDIEGHKSGETVDVPEDRATYYLMNGYASRPSFNRDEHPESATFPKDDQTLAENRKDEKTYGREDLFREMGDGLAQGDNVHYEEDPVVVPSLNPHGVVPPEVDNGQEQRKTAVQQARERKARAEREKAEADERQAENERVLAGDQEQDDNAPSPTNPSGTVPEDSTMRETLEKAEKGKDKLEDKADAKDPEDAPENDPELVKEREKAGDKVEDKSQRVEKAKEGTETTEEAEEAAQKSVRRRKS